MKCYFLCAGLMLALVAPVRIAARVTLQSVSVAPSSPSIAIGASQQFTATAHYSNGTTADATSGASWTSSNTAVATVSGGLARGISDGTATIKATYSGKSGSTVLTVNPNPPPPGTTVINFDNPACPNGNSGASLTGTFQGINWGSSPWDCEIAGSPTDTTTSASWNINQTSATFSFVTPAVLNSLKAAASGGVSGTYSISTDQGETFSTTLAANAGLLLINTGFTKPATVVTIGFTAGWTVETDDITYTVGGGSTCTPTQHNVTLSWNDPDAGMTFNLYRSGISGGPYSQIQTGITGLSVIDNTAMGGNSYYYVVTAYNGQESQYSNEAQAIVPCP